MRQNLSFCLFAAFVTLGLIGHGSLDAQEITISSPGGFHSYPAVAKTPNGEALVVYKALSSHPSDSHGILGQMFNADGEKVGDELLMNSYTTGGQENPHVSVDGNGQFTVVWDCNGSGDIRGQRIALDGSYSGTEFVVNSATTGGARSYPRVDSSDAGEFVVTWGGSAVGGDADDTVQARRFDSSGSPVGAQFTVNSVQLAYSQERSDVGVNPNNGDFVIVWESTEPTTNDDVRVRRFAADGTPVGSELIANTTLPFFQNWPKVDVDGSGNIYVAWDGETTGDSDRGIHYRKFASDGSPATAELQVNSYTPGVQNEPVLDVSMEGLMMISWQSDPNLADSDGKGIVQQIFSPDGTPGGENQANSATTGDQQWPDTSWDQRRRAFTVWESGDAIIGSITDTAFTFFPDGVDVFGQVHGARSLGSWQDHSLWIPSGTGTMTVTLDNLTDDADLYVRRVGRPDGTTFDCRSNSGGTTAEICVVASPAPTVWWISVANWSASGPIDYTLRVDFTESPDIIFKDGFESGDTSAW